MAEKKLVVGGERIRRGETRDVSLKVSETYTGAPIHLPVRVLRAAKDGPAVFVTGAVHGDELNGVGVIRELMLQKPALSRGTLILVPIANPFGFENHSRYLPDRRDLNRCFPGRKSGSLAYRLAYVLHREVIRKCDHGMDLHTAAVRRTNFPHVRGDLNDPVIRRNVAAFGCEVMVDKKAPPGSLRATAKKAGCPTFLFEAGETLKLEPGIVKLGIRGVLNVLRHLGMLDGEQVRPAYQTEIRRATRWIRSDTGGMLHFHVRPGDLVQEGDRLATCEKLFASESSAIEAPADGIVIGMTTLPAVKPGEPVCHLAFPDESLADIRGRIAGIPKTLHRRIQRELSRNIRVVEPRKGRGK